jgi:hypothetical protein
MAKEKDDKSIRDQVAAQRELNNELAKSRDLVNDIVTAENESLKTYADRMDLTSQLNENAKILATLNVSIDRLSTSQSDRGKLLLEQYSIQRDLLSDVQSKYVEILQNSNNIANSGFETIDLSREHQKLLNAITDLEEKREVLKEGEYEKEKQILDLIKDRLDLSDKMNVSQEKANELAKKFLESTTLVGHANNALLHSMEGIIDSVGSGGLGVIGSFLGKKASSLLEQTKESIQEKVVKAFQESGDSAVNAFSLAQMSLGSFVRYALPALGIAGLLGAFGLLIHTLSHLDAELSEIGKEFGVTRKEADKLHHVTIDIANEMNLVGIRSGQVLESIRESSAALGGLNILARLKDGSEGAKQLVKDFAVLKSEFGFEGGELENIQNFATATRKSIGQVVKESVKLGKGLFTSKQSIGVIAKISPTIALSFRRGSQELIKAAQKAKLLGMELSDIQSFGDNILDIETSIQAEMEARALTGKNINLDAARYYALTNDVAGLQEELLKNLGSSAEFGKMNRIQQQSLAAAFGMQVDDVTKLLLAQEKLEELGISQNKLDQIQQMNAEQLADEMRKTNSEKLKGYLETLKREKESASINERLSNIMTKIKEKIAATVSPLLEMAHSFFDSAEGGQFLDTVIKGVKDLIVAMIPIVKFLAENIWLVVAALGAIAAAKIVGGIGTIVDGFRSMTGAMKQTSDAANALGQSAGGINNATGALGGFTAFAQNAIATSVTLIAFAGSVWILSKAFENFAKLDSRSIMAGIGVMVALAAVAVGLAAASKFIAIGSGAMYILAGAMLAISGAVYIFGAGTKLLSDSIGSLADGFKKLSDLGNITSIGNSLKQAFNAISDAASIITENSSKYKNIRAALKNIGIEELVEFGKLAKEDLGKAADNVVSAIKSFGKITLDAMDFGTKSSWGAKDDGWYGLTGFVKKSGTGLIGALEELNIALGEVDLDNVEVLVKMASTDMSKIGTNLKRGIESLGKIDAGSSIESLKQVKPVFEELAEAVSETGHFGTFRSYFEPLKPLMDLDIDKLKKVTGGLKAVIYNLSDIGKMGAPGLESLIAIFQKLSNALNALDIGKLSDLGNVNADNLKKLSGLFQQPTTGMNTQGGSESINTRAMEALTSKLQTLATSIDRVNFTLQQPITARPTGTQQTITNVPQVQQQTNNTETVVTNKKLDEAIGILRQILSSTNRPAYIKIGDRTVEAIGEMISLKGVYGISTGRTFGKSTDS